MNYYVFLKFPLGEIWWAFLWGLPFLGLTRLDAIWKRRNSSTVFGGPAYNMISAMLLLAGYLMAISAYDPSHNIPDIGVPGFDSIPVVILFVFYVWCLCTIYRLHRRGIWKAYMVITLTYLMYILPSWIHEFKAHSDWG